MIEIKGMGSLGPVYSDDAEKDRLKEIKTRLGRVAFMRAMGKEARVSKVHNGISRSEGALKWVEEVFSREQWKDS